MMSLYYKILYWFRARKKLNALRKEMKKKDPYIYEE